MKDLPAQKKIPVRLLRPWLYLSLGLHGLLALLPLLSSSAPTLEAVETTEAVKIVEIPSLPTPRVAASPVPVPSLKPAIPPGSVQPQPVVPPRLSEAPSKPSNPIDRPTPRMVLPAPSTSPVPSPIPSIAPSPAANSAASPSPTPAATPDPIASPSADPNPTPADPYATFPHIAGANACADREQCRRSPDTQWRSLSRTLQQDLLSRGYELAEMPLADDTGRKVYRVSKAGEAPYYLNLISSLQGGSVYVLTQEPMTSEEMEQAAQS